MGGAKDIELIMIINVFFLEYGKPNEKYRFRSGLYRVFLEKKRIANGRCSVFPQFKRPQATTKYEKIHMRSFIVRHYVFRELNRKRTDNPSISR